MRTLHTKHWGSLTSVAWGIQFAGCLHFGRSHALNCGKRILDISPNAAY